MNGVLIVDKPAGWTSHDVVAKLRGIYHERRIGHSGTLDPMATGVLVVFLGRATRAVELCENDSKTYEAGLLLGQVTNTQDTTGEILETQEVSMERGELERVLEQFRGPQSQIPPMYSAVKIGGRKLYELARKGQTVDRKPREIFISRLELGEWNGSAGTLTVECSKGTYVRTLCHDIGQTAGCGGCMSSLRRVRAGRFTLADAVTLDEIIAAQQENRHEAMLLPVDSLFLNLPELMLGEEDTKRCRNGADIYDIHAADGDYRVYDEERHFLMLGHCERGILKTTKSFFEVNCP